MSALPSSGTDCDLGGVEANIRKREAMAIVRVNPDGQISKAIDFTKRLDINRSKHIAMRRIAGVDALCVAHVASFESVSDDY